MPIRTICPSCRTVYTLADHYAGKTVRCKECEASIIVRAARERMEEDKAQSESGVREKIQSRPPSGPRSEAGKPMRARSRRREQDDEWDDEVSSEGGNRGLVIGLIVAGAGLLLLLGGGMLTIVLIVGRSTNNPPDFPAGADAGGRPGPNPPELLIEDDADPAWPSLGMRVLPPDSVILHISGVVDNNTRDAISEKLEAIGQTDGHFSMNKKHRGDRMTVLVVNVEDAQAFSQKLDFGKVDSVKGHIITVTARKVEGPPPNADAVARALHQLKSTNAHKRREAIRQLKDALPDGRRAEVVKALLPLLNDADVFTRHFAIEALGVWGNKDERAAEAVAARLEEFGDLLQAAGALKKMGQVAEKAVIARLNHGEIQVRIMSCEILKVIGTKQSIPALEKVVAAGKDPFAGQDHLVAMQAEQTIKAIKRRPN